MMYAITYARLCSMTDRCNETMEKVEKLRKILENNSECGVLNCLHLIEESGEMAMRHLDALHEMWVKDRDSVTEELVECAKEFVAGFVLDVDMLDYLPSTLDIYPY